jgi:hypothetical protein
MSLSVCLITRNEERSLAQALGSVAGVADEVVVADTGSTDRTVAIALELGARVSHFAWQDDFGAGRNFALDQATGDWVLWLNPDEELLGAGREALHDCLGRENAFAYSVCVQDLRHADRMDSFSVIHQYRLFRRLPAVRFQGRAQPHFSPPLAELAQANNQRLFHSDITLRRHGYLSTFTEPKLRWAARLLELELRDRPGQFYYLIEYGKTLLALNDPVGHEILAEAAEQLMAVQDAPAPPSAYAQVLLEYLLTVSPDRNRSRLSREEAWELARRWFPHSPPLLWTRAGQLFQATDFRQASAILEELVRLGRTRTYDKTQAFDPSVIGESALMNLGACYTRLREFDRAESCFRSLLTSPTFGAQATQNLKRVRTLHSQADASAVGPAQGWFTIDSSGPNSG